MRGMLRTVKQEVSLSLEDAHTTEHLPTLAHTKSSGSTNSCWTMDGTFSSTICGRDNTSHRPWCPANGRHILPSVIFSQPRKPASRELLDASVILGPPSYPISLC